MFSMSRQSQLPPRCPLQKKTTTRPAQSSVSPTSCKDIELHPEKCGLHKYVSQSSILEEQPGWLDDLLSDSDSNVSGTLHRRAASDPFTFLTGLDQLNETETPDTCEPDNVLESSCTYGPNSPRRKNKPGFPENEIVSAFSEYVVQNSMRQLDGHDSVSGIPLSNSFSDACASAGQINTERKPIERHPGQRSRVRKLQYIAELESTVGILQNLGSELSFQIGSLLQQRVALSMENNTLKQQLLRMQQEKLIVDGEYQSLKKDLERLKSGLAFSSNSSKAHGWSRSAANLGHSDSIWKMLDMRKLDLNQ